MTTIQNQPKTYTLRAAATELFIVVVTVVILLYALNQYIPLPDHANAVFARAASVLYLLTKSAYLFLTQGATLRTGYFFAAGALLHFVPYFA